MHRAHQYRINGLNIYPGRGIGQSPDVACRGWEIGVLLQRPCFRLQRCNLCVQLQLTERYFLHILKPGKWQPNKQCTLVNPKTPSTSVCFSAASHCDEQRPPPMDKG